jgi:hypothetical protein
VNVVMVGPCAGCVGKSTDASHTCREKGYPPVRVYACTAQTINDATDEGREAMRQLLWAAYDELQEKRA